MKKNIKKNSTSVIIFIIIAVFYFIAAQGMETSQFVITTLRGFSTGSVTFLVAAGFSLIFGLLNVLNLALGALYMIGAYIGWTVYVRPDTFIDVLTPLLIILSAFVLRDVWNYIASRPQLKVKYQKWISWGLILMGLLVISLIMTRYPIAIWDLDNYPQSPITYSFMADQGMRLTPMEATFENISPVIALFGLLIGSCLFALGISYNNITPGSYVKVKQNKLFLFAAVNLAAVLILIFNSQLTNFLLEISTNWLFLIALFVAVLTGLGLGALLESTLIRPLYDRPIYQLMLTIGIATIGIQIVQAVWGRPEFVWPKPAFFRGTGEGCPATSLADLWEYNCSTVFVLGGRVRVYDEIFIPIVGVLVLILVWVILKRTRIGMVIRAGVQDSQMVEALGINVRRVFTQVFSLGVGLAAFGGALAAPSVGLSTAMGERLLLSALIALAIGGLGSYPGAALGSLLVGMTQQFLIRYGQIGIPIPFTDIVIKPSPPIVPASTVFLMVVILLILPSGLLGKKENS
jgi:branched-chain amino acid transport system permease protein